MGEGTHVVFHRGGAPLALKEAGIDTRPPVQPVAESVMGGGCKDE